MKMEILRVLCLTGTSGEQERKATAYPLVMHYANKAAFLNGYSLLLDPKCHNPKTNE